MMIKGFLLLVVLSIIVLVSFPNIGQAQPTELLRAEALFQLKKYDEAAERFNQQESRESWFKKRLVEVNWHAGNYAIMKKAVSNLRSIDKGFGYFFLAKYYAKIENHDSAFIMLDNMLKERYKPSRSLVKTDKEFELLKNNPLWDSLWKQSHYNDFDLSVEMAKQELDVKNYDLALQLMDELIEDKPYRDIPWYLRSKLLYEQGVHKTALDDIDNAIKEDEKEAIYYGHRAEVYLKLEKPRKALKDAIKAIELADYDPRWYEIAVRCGLSIEKYEDVRNLATTYLQAMPEQENAHFYMASIVFNTGSCMHALPHINKALELEDRNPEYYYLRAQIYQACKVYKQAIIDYNMCMDFWPRKAELYLGRGICRHELGQTKQGCSDLVRAYNLGSLKADDLRRDLCN
jgi:tetratricopeptide (TPR) repeat protein